MDPKPIWTADLFIHEPVRWFPCGDLAPPPNGKTSDAQAVIKHCADAHCYCCRRDRTKVQPEGRDGVEIGWIRKEREYFLDWPRQQKFAPEFVNIHQSRLISSAHAANHHFVSPVNCDCFWTKFRRRRSAGLAVGKGVLGMRKGFPLTPRQPWNVMCNVSHRYARKSNLPGVHSATLDPRLAAARHG